MAPRIEQLAVDLVEGCAEQLAETGRFDVIEGLAEPLPVLVIAELLGVPQADRHLLRPWSQAIVRMYEMTRPPAQEQAAQQACAAVPYTHIDGYKRQRPARGRL